MSRAARRASRAGARSRRTPVRPARGAGFNIPWVPFVIVAAIAGVVGLVVFLIVQSGQEGGLPNSEAQAIEADPAPDLPGQFVDLQTIYGGKYGGDEEGNNTAGHVRETVDYTVQGELPPAGGPHWGSGQCEDTPDDSAPFCGPLKWGIYRVQWEPESLVHNMEHGGVVVWYNTTDQGVIDELEGLVRDKVEDEDKLVVLLPFDGIPDESVAMTAWARRQILPISEYSKDQVEEFIDKLERRFNPEGL